jgi:aminoglycoside 6'-N-acetyltransferase
VIGDEVDFRRLTEADLPMLAGWLAQPHVYEFWREDSDLAGVEERYRPALRGEDPTELFVIEVGGRPVGLIQRYLIGDNPEWAAAFPHELGEVASAAGIDYLIGDASLVGKGIGSTAIHRFSEQTLDRYPGADVVVACQQANPASWRALEKAGYAREWAGTLDSDDPSDAGPSYVYRYRRDR